MKAGIIIHSQSGHTATFATRIAEKLRAKGIDSEVHLLRTTKAVKPGIKDIEFRREIDITPYDIVLFGAPVWAFSLSNVMQAYLKKIPSLNGKKVGGFVTHGLPFMFTGPSRALSIYSETFDLMMADTVPGAAIFWGFSENRKKCDTAAEKFVATLL